MNSTSSASRSAASAARPITLPRLIVMCAAALGAGVGVARWVEGRGAISYAGTLQSRTTCITAGRTARLAEVSVAPGQRVGPGETLLGLSDERLSASIAAKKREVTEREVELEQVKASADVEIEWRRRELQNEAFQAQLKAAAVTQERLAMQVEQLAWQEHLSGIEVDNRALPALAEANSPFRSIILGTQVLDEKRLQAMLREDAAAAAAEALTSQLLLCEQQLDRLRKLDQELPNKVRVSAGVELALTRLTQTREELAALELQHDALLIKSPSHGVIGAVHHQPGDVIQPGETILEIFDDDRRHLTALIPSTAVAKLLPGTKLTLIFPARQKRIGLVAAIPPQVMPSDDMDSMNDSQVAVRIEPAGKLWPKLPVGSRVKVQVPQ